MTSTRNTTIRTTIITTRPRRIFLIMDLSPADLFFRGSKAPTSYQKGSGVGRRKTGVGSREPGAGSRGSGAGRRELGLEVGSQQLMLRLALVQQNSDP